VPWAPIQAFGEVRRPVFPRGPTALVLGRPVDQRHGDRQGTTAARRIAPDHGPVSTDGHVRTAYVRRGLVNPLRAPPLARSKRVHLLQTGRSVGMRRLRRSSRCLSGARSLGAPQARRPPSWRDRPSNILIEELSRRQEEGKGASGAGCSRCSQGCEDGSTPSVPCWTFVQNRRSSDGGAAVEKSIWATEHPGSCRGAELPVEANGTSINYPPHLSQIRSLAESDDFSAENASASAITNSGSAADRCGSVPFTGTPPV